ncbi:MAG: D-alanyl-D-alanine carboxypeptidase family protein [Candidatus Planktophila sp.]|nr:D-alanyl-D-alanine carboxypeptidase family protein [Candidatus Planktophila sp.]
MRIQYISLVLVAILAGGVFGFYVGAESNSDSSIVQTPTPTPTPSVSASAVQTPLQLLCFEPVNNILRNSDVIAGCLESERSLGATALSAPQNPVNQLNQFLEVRFLAAQAAAEKEGVRLAITSGFRSFDRQATLFKAAVKKYGSEEAASHWVLPPASSHHPLGLAIDVNYPNDLVSTLWLEKNGFTYGLCRAYVNEWWHFEALAAPGQPCPPMIADASSLFVE